MFLSPGRKKLSRHQSSRLSVFHRPAFLRRCLSFPVLLRRLSLLSIAHYSFFIILFSSSFSSAQVCPNWNLVGDATSIGTTVYLTQNVASQSGACWNSTQIDLSQGFTQTYNASLGAAGGADGIAFVLQKDQNGLSALSGNGGPCGACLGYSGTNPVSPSVAFAINTYDTTFKTGQLEVFENGVTTAAVCPYVTPSASVTGCPYVFPATILNGGVDPVTVTWDAVNKILSFTIVDAGGTARTMVYNRDLVGSVFQNQTMVYYGFTAATGGSSNQQWISYTGACATATATPVCTWVQTTGPAVPGTTPSANGINTQAGSLYSFSNGATVTSMAISMTAATAPVSAILGIYANVTGNTPGRLLVQTQQTAVTAGLNTLPVPATALPAGSYWLAFYVTGTTGTVACTGSGTSYSEGISGGPYNGMQDPFTANGTAGAASTLSYQVYANSCVGFVPSWTSTPTITNTPTITPTPTKTSTPTITSTNTSTPTITLTPTKTATPTITLTPTKTSTPTNTPTSTNTSTPTQTPTDTAYVTCQSAFSTVTSAFPGSVNTYTLALNIATPVTNPLLVVQVSIKNTTATINTATYNNVNLVPALGVTDTANGHENFIFYLPSSQMTGLGASRNIVITASAAQTMDIGAMVFTGMDPIAPLGNSASTVLASTANPSMPFSTSQQNSIVVGLFNVYNSRTFTLTGTGETPEWSFSNTGFSTEGNYRTATAINSYPVTCVLSGASISDILAVEFYAANCNPTATPTPSPTSTPTITLSPTKTATPTNTPTNTPTATPTYTNTFTYTYTYSYTPSVTNTPTNTLTPTLTKTNTPTPNMTGTTAPTATYQAQETQTAIAQSSFTPTVTSTQTTIPIGSWNLTTSYVPNVFSPAGTTNPWSVASDGVSFLVVDDGDADSNVYVYDITGQTLLYTIPTTGGYTGSLAIDSSDELYIPEYGTGVVGYKLGASSAVYDYTWTGLGNCVLDNSVRIDPNGNLLVADDNGIWSLAWADDSGSNIIPASSTNYCEDVALDGNGNYFVDYYLNNSGVSIAEYNSSYTLVNSFNGTGWPKALGSYSGGIVTDKQGNLFITDWDNNRVVYAANQGGYLGEIDGAGVTNFYNPSCLAYDPTGNLFVVDCGNKEVDEFTSAPTGGRIMNVVFGVRLEPTPTPSPTPTSTCTPAPPTSTCTFTPTPTSTSTSTSTPTSTDSMTPTASLTASPSATPSYTATPYNTATPTLTLTPNSPLLTPTYTLSPTPNSSFLISNSAAAWPNISQDGTPIQFRLTLTGATPVQLNLYNLTGELVYSVSFLGQPGLNTLTWNLRNQSGAPIAAGLYIYKIQAGSQTFSGKIAVIH